MMIDRTTLWQLELLVNSKSGKAHPSLMSTIDRTKTTVGSRLLRTNLMAPPTRIETIEARLELVDSFLRSSEFFFDVYEHLENLPDVDKMLSNITLVSRAVGLGGGVGGAGLREEQPSEQLVRLASKGIASLVSVKAVLSSTPYLAAALQAQLDALDRESGTTTPQPNHQRGVNDDEDGTVARSSLLVGLGAATATDSRNSSTTSSRDKNHLLRAIVSVLQQPQLSYVLKLITDIYTESTTHARNANARQHQECFALRDDSETGLLTVLRRSYKENVDDIYKAADALAEQHNLHVTVRYSAARGYYLSVPANSVGDLPGVFLHPTRSGRSINFETQLVASLNARAMDNVRDLLMITHERIERVLEKAREPACYDSLAALCDAIALLDLCHSYADVVSLSKLPWCRPLVFDYASRHNAVGDSSGQNPTALNGGGMIIRNGRFPIDVASPSAAESEADGPSLHFIPNDTYVPAGTSFTVISGVNGAGYAFAWIFHFNASPDQRCTPLTHLYGSRFSRKSTYLKQVAVIAVLAHIGCYVPAEQASIPLFDRLCTRIGNADDQEHNISTFMLEMKETAFICTNASRNSLILLDELGRATSNEDGVAIAWAVSEYLLTRQSTVFFVTHYPQLTKLAEVYPGVVQNIHLEAHLNPGATVNQQLSYTHKVKAGWCSVSSEYGVELAAYCGWTQDVIDQARAYERQVRSLLPEDVSYQDHVTSACSRAFNSVSELVQGLKRLSRSNHSWSTLQNTLDDMQHSFYRSFRDDPEAEAVIRGLLQIAPSSVSSRSPTSSLFDKAGVEKDSRSIHEDHQENQRAEDWSQSGCEEPSLLLSPKADDAGSYASASSSCSSSTCTSARDDSSNSSSSASSGEARSSQAFGGDNRFRKTSRTTVFGKSVDP
jgi:DNA mismatch repair protein MSH4